MVFACNLQLYYYYQTTIYCIHSYDCNMCILQTCSVQNVRVTQIMSEIIIYLP